MGWQGEARARASRAPGAHAPREGQLPPGLVRLMAVTCAVTVANLYYAQPLLSSIAGSLHAGQGSAPLLVTASQAGYALGLLLIVPAGDIMRRRPLLTTLLAICSITLAGCALAPSLPVLGAAAALAGVTSVVVQMLVPYAATLASDAERGKVIGALMGGWRAVYALAAVMMAVTTLALRRALPDHAPQLSISYTEQLHGHTRAGAGPARRSPPPRSRWRAWPAGWRREAAGAVPRYCGTAAG